MRRRASSNGAAGNAGFVRDWNRTVKVQEA